MPKDSPLNLLTADTKHLQTELSNGRVTSRQLIDIYLAQISKHDSYLHAMIWTTPSQSVFDFADTLDKERSAGKLRGPLHGIPFIVKDNIATDPKLGLGTTAGSLAFLTARPAKNAKVVDLLIEAGANLIGKTNLSELASWKGVNLTSGWSPVGDQVQSAYVRGGVYPDNGKDGPSNPSGSSSGSAVAVSTGYAPFSLGTETDGSLTVPAGRAALYTIKPTIGLVSGEGVLPVSHNFDSVGPMTKTAYDLAVVLDVLIDPQSDSRGGKSYTESLTYSWSDIAVGTLDPAIWKFPDEWLHPVDEATKELNEKFAKAYALIKSHAKRYVGHIEMITPDAFTHKGKSSENMVTRHSNQDTLLACRDTNTSPEEYQEHLDHLRDVSRAQGIDHVLDKYGLDVIIGPADSLMCSMATASGYPIAAMPLGRSKYNGRAFGVAALARANQEALLVKVMSAWESTFGPRLLPDFDHSVE